MSIGGDLNSLHMLPSKMKTEIALHVNLETLRKVRAIYRYTDAYLYTIHTRINTYIHSFIHSYRQTYK